MSVPTPRRGEVWMANFSPGRGSEQRGIRPALVIQNDVGNQHGATTIVAAITSTIKIYPVTVLLKKGEGNLLHASMVNLAQILTLDKSRLQRRVGVLSSRLMEKVDAAIKVSLDVG
ncbi:MAG: type II toxin-antitoxin system PemK/MazF family toxin [candidate division NC10 bacterium]|nr:type II toxin-antitoxin system PemK/MazF family toxin [candidate division NC10 bacterium]